VLDDSTTPAPQTSYGSQKVISEYLVSDFSRKGYIDAGRCAFRTIVVRARKGETPRPRLLRAPSFAKPLKRRDLRLPVGAETGVWLLSPPPRGRSLYPRT